MSLVWRKIQRSNKKAAKFRFTATFLELSLHCSNKWQPAKLCLAWVHRRRRYATKEHKWEPTITDPYHGLIVWPSSGPPECLEMTTTMYRDSQNDSFDDKEWTFVVEEVTSHGKRKPVAGINLNMRLFTEGQASVSGSKTELKLKLNPLRDHVTDCRLQLTLNCLAIGQEGDAVDDDMQSVASQISNNQISLMKDQTQPRNFDLVDDDLDADLIEKFDTNASLDSLDKMVKQTSTEISDLIGRHDKKPADKPNFLPAHQKHVDLDAEVKKCAEILPRSPGRLSGGADSSTDLMTWCQNVTRGYKNVRITDFSASWRNGLAFCALIHRFRPDLVQFDALEPSNIFKNCSLAFDAAANLGVAKIISPSDMVVLSIPDKIAVMTYVSLLRDLFTGQLNMPHHMDRSSSGHQVQNERISLVDMVKDDRPSFAPVSKLQNQSLDRISLTMDDVKKPSLMTRNQLMNPFDSDEEGPLPKNDILEPKLTAIGQIDVEKSTRPLNAQCTAQVIDLSAQKTVDQPTSPVVAGLGFTSNVVASRALKLLEQYGKQEQPSTDPEELKRKEALKERARRLIEEAKFGTSPTNTEDVCKTVKITDVIKSVQYPSSVIQPDFKSPSAPATRQVSPEYAGLPHKLPSPSSPITKESLQQETKRVFLAQKVTAAPMAQISMADHFKRFGSMRGQELARNLNVLSGRIAQTVRSQSTPKEVSFQQLAQHAPPKTPSSPLKSIFDFAPGSPTSAFSPMGSDAARSQFKLTTPTSLLSGSEIAHEMDILSTKQQMLDKKATQVERRWRQIMQEASGSDEEQAVMNEYLALLNERNMLTRREMHLSLLENINEYEEKFTAVQNQLSDLIKIDDHEKTELHKKRIDRLMEDLIGIVNKRDELMQQLIQHEQGTEEDAELAADVILQSAGGGLLPNHHHHGGDKDTCAVQ